MSYKIITTDKFDKTFKKLDRQTQSLIKGWIEKNLIGTSDPRQHGKGLTSNRSGEWRYRIGKYRILAEIRENELVLVFVDIAHRSKVYSQ